jgi:3-methyladenine DNA glycosylase AlkC
MAEAFKNLINPKVVESYSKGLQAVYREFPQAQWDALSKQLKPLELKARTRLLADGLRSVLPAEFPAALGLLNQAVQNQKIEGFALWPACEFLHLHGLEHFDLAFETMQSWTQLFTAEFAVRPFIQKYPERSFVFLQKASKSPNVHIRRWASEGTRPRLPWGQKLNSLITDPRPTFPILEQLKFDPELYVRKSVANHLNDIAKDHPELVVRTLKRWKKEVLPSFQKEFLFTLRQSLRTLIKKGHPQALELMGVQVGKSPLRLSPLRLQSKTVPKHGTLHFEFELKNPSNQAHKFILDYVIEHQRANGQLSAKVFKLKTGEIKPNSRLTFSKKHSFKPITTRKYYPGLHQVGLQLNGRPTKRVAFTLRT